MKVLALRLFLSFGELGPGDNIGLIASKTSATAVRGQYYGIAAAIGKVGAFVGTYVIPIIQANAPNEISRGQDPFFVSSSLCLATAAFALFLLPYIGQVSLFVTCLAEIFAESSFLFSIADIRFLHRTPSLMRTCGSESIWKKMGMTRLLWERRNRLDKAHASLQRCCQMCLFKRRVLSTVSFYF
jgi:hypothetical protein